MQTQRYIQTKTKLIVQVKKTKIYRLIKQKNK